jgi:hypothetical protein
MSTAIIKGSVKDVAQKTGRTLAEAFLFVDAIVIVDTSASMEVRDVPKSELKVSRYDEACEQLRRLQAQLPGKIAVIAFSSSPVYCPNGHAQFLKGSTNLAAALRLIQPADDCDLRFIVISDGEPDNEQDCLTIAQAMKTRIDTIYVGPPDGKGADFLRRLAAIHGGQSSTQAGEILKLGETINKLLTTKTV